MSFYTLALLKAAVWAAIILSTLLYLQWVERKVLAHIQIAHGPIARRTAWSPAALG